MQRTIYKSKRTYSKFSNYLEKMEAPIWLTEDYVLESLKKHYKDESLEINMIEIKPALGKGENFGGILTSVRVNYETCGKLKQKSLLVKSTYEGDEFSKEKMAPYDIFNREMSIYQNILPKITALLQEIKDDDKLFAKALSVDYERQALIFEDLREHGFVMANRLAGFDLEHVKLILRKIAKMHAASAVLNERTKGSLESYDRGFFNRYTNNYASFFVGNLIACAQYLNKLPGYEYYANKLFGLEPYYMEIGKKCFTPISTQLNVFAHGDLWTNNVMFRYENDLPKDVLLIDFQYSFWGSPALDLHHFFNTSLKEDLRTFSQDTLFQYYHGIFVETLKKLNYQSHAIPTLHQFRLEAEEKRFFAFHSSCIIQPVMLNENCDDADFNALMNTDERAKNFRRNLYKNPKVQSNLKSLLPTFDNRGILDVDQCC